MRAFSMSNCRWSAMRRNSPNCHDRGPVDLLQRCALHAPGEREPGKAFRVVLELEQFRDEGLLLSGVLTIWTLGGMGHLRIPEPTHPATQRIILVTGPSTHRPIGP